MGFTLPATIAAGALTDASTAALIGYSAGQQIKTNAVQMAQLGQQTNYTIAGMHSNTMGVAGQTGNTQVGNSGKVIKGAKDASGVIGGG